MPSDRFLKMILVLILTSFIVTSVLSQTGCAVRQYEYYHVEYEECDHGPYRRLDYYNNQRHHHHRYRY